MLDQFATSHRFFLPLGKENTNLEVYSVNLQEQQLTKECGTDSYVCN